MNTVHYYMKYSIYRQFNRQIIVLLQVLRGPPLKKNRDIFFEGIARYAQLYKSDVKFILHSQLTSPIP